VACTKKPDVHIVSFQVCYTLMLKCGSFKIFQGSTHSEKLLIGWGLLMCVVIHAPPTLSSINCQMQLVQYVCWVLDKGVVLEKFRYVGTDCSKKWSDMKFCPCQKCQKLKECVKLCIFEL
jgi:hypothetical protein